MTTKPYSFRLSEPAERKLLELAELYGSQARVVEVAIDRLYHSEIRRDTMTRMSTAAQAGEALYEAATNMSIAEALENYGSAQAVADAVVEQAGHGDTADVVAYIEHAS
jgi:hypothetical protein